MSLIKITGRNARSGLVFAGGWLLISCTAVLSVLSSGWVSELFFYPMAASIAITVMGLVSVVLGRKDVGQQDAAQNRFRKN
jgi:hypothetical protein